MNRRRFLKYAGVTAAVVGASALGLNYVSQPSPSMASPTTSTTLVPKRITTNASLSASTESFQLASLQGRLFFDYNGNGMQDGEEPAVAAVTVQLKDSTGATIAETLTDSSGDYKLEDVRTGSYKLHVEADKRFRYMCMFPDEFRAVSDDYSSSLEQSMHKDIGLMEGFLTLPFTFGTHAELYSYFDHDPTPGKVKNYLGDTTLALFPKHQPGTFDGHQGIDWSLPLETKLVASAPGKVLELSENEAGGKYIDILHSNGMVTSYGHISEVLGTIGEWVERGDAVALSGETGSPGQPHIHFALFREGTAVDPFRDVFGDSPGYWTKENDPQYAVT